MSTRTATLETKLNQEIYSFLKRSKSKAYSFDVGKNFTYAEFLNNRMMIIAAIRQGIPYSLFDLIQTHTPFSESDWANFLDISTKSLQRYKASPDHHFKSIHTEKIIEMAEVTHVGLDTFGSMEKLRLWLNTPNFALGGHLPIDLLKDSYGKELVMSELTRLNHGILV